MKQLADIKWQSGYSCRKCGCERYIGGKQLYSRRNKRCNYDESPTAHTLIHKAKFGIENAFEMLYDIATSKKTVVVFGSANASKWSKLLHGFLGTRPKRRCKGVAESLWMEMYTSMSLKSEPHRKANKEEVNLKRRYALSLHLSTEMVIAEGVTPRSLKTLAPNRCVPYLTSTSAHKLIYWKYGGQVVNRSWKTILI